MRHSKGCFCPRNLLFLEFGEKKQIPRFARDDNKVVFPQPVKDNGLIPPCGYVQSGRIVLQRALEGSFRRGKTVRATFP